MKKSLAVLFVLVVMAFVMNSAFAEGQNCSGPQEPTFTETSASIR